MQQIIPGLYTFTGLIVGRVYLTEDTDGLTLIDASVSAAANQIIKQLEAKNYKITDVKRILITHAHPDHVGALPKLKELSGAQVMVSHPDRPITEGKNPVPTPPRASLPGIYKYIVPPPTTLNGTPVDRELKEGDVIPEALGGLQVLEVPGHSMGHLAFWQPEKRVLICGDVMSSFGSKIRLPFPMFTVSMKENIRSVKKLAALDAAVLCCGHGTPLTKNVAADIKAFLTRVEALNL